MICIDRMFYDGTNFVSYSQRSPWDPIDLLSLSHKILLAFILISSSHLRLGLRSDITIGQATRSELFFSLLSSYPPPSLYFATFIRNSLACLPLPLIYCSYSPPLSPLFFLLHLMFPPLVQSRSTENIERLSDSYARSLNDYTLFTNLFVVYLTTLIQ